MSAAISTALKVALRGPNTGKEGRNQRTKFYFFWLGPNLFQPFVVFKNISERKNGGKFLYREKTMPGGGGSEEGNTRGYGKKTITNMTFSGFLPFVHFSIFVTVS